MSGRPTAAQVREWADEAGAVWRRAHQYRARRCHDMKRGDRPPDN